MTDQATSKPSESKLTFTILLRPSGKNAWIAQCLEYDVAAQGPTADECKVRFMRTLTSRILRDLIQRKEPLSDLPEAPRRYFDESLHSTTQLSGPELPVYVPVKKLASHGQTRFSATARFLETKDQAPSAQA